MNRLSTLLLDVYFVCVILVYRYYCYIKQTLVSLIIVQKKIHICLIVQYPFHLKNVQRRVRACEEQSDSIYTKWMERKNPVRFLSRAIVNCFCYLRRHLIVVALLSLVSVISRQWFCRHRLPPRRLMSVLVLYEFPGNTKDWKNI